MGTRIHNRVSGSFFPSAIDVDTEANLLTDGGYVGPFTMGAVAELLFRVEEFDVYQYADVTGGVTSIDATGTTSHDSANERELYGNIITAAKRSSSYEGNGIVATSQIIDDGVNPFVEVEILWNIAYDFVRNTRFLIKDENDKYWMRGYVIATRENVDLDANIALYSDPSFAGSTDFSISASIVLASGTFPVTVYYSDTVGSEVYSNVALTITASKWWEYADKAGDPAWSSTTGLAVNNGPFG